MQSKRSINFKITSLVILLGSLLTTSLIFLLPVKANYTRSEFLPQGAAGSRPLNEGCASCQSEDDKPHLLGATYYRAGNGLKAVLMLNNKGPQTLEVQPTMYSLAGERRELPTIFVPGTSFREIDLDEYGIAGTPFEQGSLQLFHRGKDLVLGAQMKLIDLEHSLVFEEKLVELATEFKTSRQESLWWLPARQSEVRLILSNTSEATLSVGAKVSGEAPKREGVESLTLAPHETRVVDVRDVLRHKPAGALSLTGGVSLEHSGSPGALLARLLIEDATLGYSLSQRFYDPKKGKSTKLQGAGLRLDIGGEALTPVVIARNVGESTSTIKGRIPYTAGDGSTSAIELPELRLAPGEAGVVETVNAFTGRHSARNIKTAGLEFEYSGAPGSVVMAAQSVSRSRNQVFQVPLWDIEAQRSSTGGYPWNLENDNTTVVYIKNVTARPQKYALELNIAGRQTSYVRGVKTVEPGQTVTLDIRELRDGQVPDEQGRVIPADATQGQIHWSVRSADKLPVIGRIEQVDVANQISASYACQNCCGDSFDYGYLSPSLIANLPGSINQFLTQELYRTCYGILTQPNNVYSGYYSSGNTAVATVDYAGQATAISVGDTYINNTWTVYESRWQPFYSGNPNEPGECVTDQYLIGENADMAVATITGVSASGATQVTQVTGDANIMHFVTPKGASNSTVTLTATLSPDTTANRARVDWEGATESTSNPLEATVPKDAAAKHVVKVKIDGNVAREMRVWVVWATITSTDIAIQYQEPINVAVGVQGAAITGGYNFTHTIAPGTIITDANRPNLSGANTTAPPGGNHPLSGLALSGGANKKWDNSRQIRAKTLNPAGIPNGSFTQPPPPANINYPASDVEGNDDGGTGDETNDPYANGGVLNGTDAPLVGIAHSAGANGDTFEWRIHFMEFTRLEIQGTWHRISDFYPWRIHLRFIKAGGKWVNDSTTKALDNSGY